jgi:hypothetical protein
MHAATKPKSRRGGCIWRHMVLARCRRGFQGSVRRMSRIGSGTGTRASLGYSMPKKSEQAERTEVEGTARLTLACSLSTLGKSRSEEAPRLQTKLQGRGALPRSARRHTSSMLRVLLVSGMEPVRPRTYHSNPGEALSSRLASAASPDLQGLAKHPYFATVPADQPLQPARTSRSRQCCNRAPANS